MGIAAYFRLVRAGYVLAREGAFSIVEPEALPPALVAGIRFARLFERARREVPLRPDMTPAQLLSMVSALPKDSATGRTAEPPP